MRAHVTLKRLSVQRMSAHLTLPSHTHSPMRKRKTEQRPGRPTLRPVVECDDQHYTRVHVLNFPFDDSFISLSRSCTRKMGMPCCRQGLTVVVYITCRRAYARALLHIATPTHTHRICVYMYVYSRDYRRTVLEQKQAGAPCAKMMTLCAIAIVALVALQNCNTKTPHLLRNNLQRENIMKTIIVMMMTMIVVGVLVWRSE